MLGTAVGKYRIVGQLGRGATGIVYKAVDDTLGRDVALKVLNPALSDPEILKRFRSEATVLASLNHPGIATIYDLVQSETELLMVMELVRGETLEALSERLGPLPAERAAYLVDGILSALEHAHGAGVVHRDMKPSNVMVTESGRVKVMDFGVARARGSEHITVDGYLVGTPAYMAPEQVLGHSVDGRADVYSVGVIFYRLLTRGLPFGADTAVGMLQQQIADSPTPLRLQRHGLPDWCETIVQRALAKSPDVRFQNAAEFRDALGRATGLVTTTELASQFSVVESSLPAAPASPPNRTLVMPAADAALAAKVLASAPRKAHTARAASLLVAFAAGVAVLAYVPTQGAIPVAPANEPPAAAAAPVEVPVASTKVASKAPPPAKLVRPLSFETKALVGEGRGQSEHDARLVLSDRRLTVTATTDRTRLLYAVPYDHVISISYSRGRDPMWNSPKGPATVTRAQGSALHVLGIYAQRHWITVRTKTDAAFLIMRFDEDEIGRVRSALEARTGRKLQVVGKRGHSS
jgi:serine/threonine-protein kinase